MKNEKEPVVGRRNFLKSTGILLLVGSLKAENEITDSTDTGEFNALNENSRMDIGEKGKEIIQKAYDLGYKFEADHGGCARCTIAALQDAIDFIPQDKGLFRAASCLDGGATPTKLANCGAFSGSGMVIGWLCGTQRFGDNSFSHKLIHKVHKRFEEEYGSVICAEVRKKAVENCPQVVAKASQWLAEIVLRQFTNYKEN